MVEPVGRQRRPETGLGGGLVGVGHRVERVLERLPEDDVLCVVGVDRLAQLIDVLVPKRRIEIIGLGHARRKRRDLGTPGARSVPDACAAADA